MADLNKSPYRLETTDGPRTLWEYNLSLPDREKSGTKDEDILFCFRALREEETKELKRLEVMLLGRGYYKADMLVVHEAGFKTLKQVWVTDDPIGL